MKKTTLREMCVVLLTVTACLSLVMLTAEADTLLGQMACTSVAMAVLALSAKGLDKLGAFDEEDRP